MHWFIGFLNEINIRNSCLRVKSHALNPSKTAKNDESDGLLMINNLNTTAESECSVCFPSQTPHITLVESRSGHAAAVAPLVSVSSLKTCLKGVKLPRSDHAVLVLCCFFLSCLYLFFYFFFEENHQMTAPFFRVLFALIVSFQIFVC